MEQLFRSIPQYLPDDYYHFIMSEPLYYIGIDCALILLMVLSMVILSCKQKLKILIPAAFSIFITAISMFIFYYVYREKRHNNNVFFQICNVFPQVTSTDMIVSMICQISFITFLVCMIPVLRFFRFNIQAVYYAILTIDKVVY